MQIDEQKNEKNACNLACYLVQLRQLKGATHKQGKTQSKEKEVKVMNENIIIEMGKLQAELDVRNARMDELKAMLREQANGVQACYTAGDYTVTVSRPGTPSVSLDTKKLASKAPKLYAELMAKYGKTGAPKSPAVKVYTNKK